MRVDVHWNKFKRQWTIHTYKGCNWGTYVVIHGKWNTMLKPERKSNPRGWAIAEHTQVEVLSELPSNIVLLDKLWYDVTQVSFNILAGDNIIFTPEGAYLFKVEGK